MNPTPVHVWETKDQDGGHCKHLALCKEGAIQAHLLCNGLAGYGGKIKARDLGPITEETDPRPDHTILCFDPHCILYSLLFTE